MATQIQYPLINGYKYSHASAEIQIGDKLYTAITAIDWSETLEPTAMRGTRPEKIARTLGEHDAEGSFSIPLEDFAALTAALGPGYMGKNFNIVVNYSNEGEQLTKVELIGCRITEHSGGSEEGGDLAIEECSIDIMRIAINGVLAVPGMLT